MASFEGNEPAGIAVKVVSTVVAGASLASMTVMAAVIVFMTVSVVLYLTLANIGPDVLL